MLRRRIVGQSVEELAWREYRNPLDGASIQKMMVARNDDVRISDECSVNKLIIVCICSDPTAPACQCDEHRYGAKSRENLICLLRHIGEFLNQLFPQLKQDRLRR